MNYSSSRDDGGFTLIHADPSLLVVKKPTRLLSVPGRGEDKQDALIRRVLLHYPDALIVHRLDFDTSGLLVIARGKEMHRRLSLLFQERKTLKRYIALVAGRLDPKTGTVDLPICVDWPNRPLHKVDFVAGKPSLTRWRVLSYDAENDTSRVELIPVTGRTHQLRVHMHAIGHVILGDPLYADSIVKSKAERLLLHASFLAFTHPESGDFLRFECAPDF
jgi:tRNA pseudouridine32 synthase/23S rRNA pseudouridine746 synthase